MAESADRRAPGRLDVVRAFVNTRDVEADTDALGDPAALGAYLSGWRLLPDGAALRASDLVAAVELREALRVLLLAHNEPATEVGGAGAVLSRITTDAGVQPVLTASGAVGYRVSATGGTGALGGIAAIVYAAAAHGAWARLKACSAPSCRWAYFDASRNRGSRWCDMQVCGNRAKGQAFRARRSAPRS